MIRSKVRNIRLTKYGRIFLEHTDKILGEVTSGLGKFTGQLYSSHGISPEFMCECPDENAISALVEKDFGIALVADVEAIGQRKVCILPLSGQKLIHTVYLGHKIFYKSPTSLSHIGCLFFTPQKRCFLSQIVLCPKVPFKSGTVSVGSFSSTSIQWMPQIIKGMKQNYPNVEIYLSHSPYHVIEQHLRDGIIDCGFISSLHIEPCDFIPLMEDEYFVVLPEGHYLETYETIPLEALLEEDIILMKDGSTYGTAYYDTANILEPIYPKTVQTVEDDFVALAMVNTGLGITVLPKLILDCVAKSPVVKHFAIPRYRTLGIAVKSLEDATVAPPIGNIAATATTNVIFCFCVHIDTSKKEVG